jgi:3-oxoacyl-[acyl-carrier protein] reductase
VLDSEDAIMARTERVACIVGAGGGIGAAIARRFAADKWSPLFLMDRGAAGDEIVRETGGVAIALDLAEPETIAAAFAQARARAPRLDALVLAAGIVDNHKLATLAPARWDEIIAVNLTGPFLCLRAAQAWLADGGRIVTLGSLAGRTGGVLTGTAYAASKGGIESLTKSVAQELAARGITVNCVAPGIVDTPMLAAHTPERRAGMASAVPLRRMAAPHEVAATVAFLCSIDAGYITGAVVPVNGGMRME